MGLVWIAVLAVAALVALDAIGLGLVLLARRRHERARGLPAPTRLASPTGPTTQVRPLRLVPWRPSSDLDEAG